MSSFGARLKHERESRNVTLREISAATNVGIHLLEALETNDFKSLPGGPFNKGFVRAYARHLGIDAEAAVDAYSREEKAMGLHTPDAHRQEAQEEVKLFEMRREGGRTTLILDMVLVQRILLGAGALLVLLLGTWLLWPSNSEEAAAGPAALPGNAASRSTPGDLPAGSRPPATSPPVQTADRGDSSSSGDRPVPVPTRQDPAPAAQDPESRAAAEETAGSATAPRQESRAVPPAPVATAPAPAVTDSPLSIVDFGVGTGVSNRMLTGRGDRFTTGTQVWFWTRTVGGKPGDTLTHVWIHEDGQTITYDRNLGGAHWRNSSRKSLKSTSVGRWVVEARDSAGRVLARTAFQCVAP